MHILFKKKKKKKELDRGEMCSRNPDKLYMYCSDLYPTHTHNFEHGCVKTNTRYAWSDHPTK